MINSEHSFQVGDTLDGLLEELHYLHNQVEHADPIAANPDSLREQINENNVSKNLKFQNSSFYPPLINTNLSENVVNGHPFDISDITG